MHNIIHSHDLRSRKGCALPCLEVPAFREQKVSKIPARNINFPASGCRDIHTSAHWGAPLVRKG